ncbi:MAG: hypothetical protein KAW83_03665 [Dehalococcoidia bacterium]|nr:hypothetical protein [Dehalococcoidia bacterium]
MSKVAAIFDLDGTLSRRHIWTGLQPVIHLPRPAQCRNRGPGCPIIIKVGGDTYNSTFSGYECSESAFGQESG